MRQLCKYIVSLVLLAQLSGCMTKQVKEPMEVVPETPVVMKPINEADKPRMQQLEILMQGEDAQKAEQLALALLQEYPNNAGLHINLGALDIRLGQFELALQHLTTGCKLAPENIHCSLFKGQALLGLARYEDAEKAYQQALEIDEQSLYAHYGLGVIYDLYLLDYAKAGKHYQAFLDGADDETSVEDVKRVKIWKRLLKRKQS